MLDHHQRISRIAQPFHHVDHAAHVTRMQADRRLVKHEQGIHQRSPERGGQVDALHLATGQRARLPVEGQVTETYRVQEAKPGADFSHQQVGGFIERCGQLQRVCKVTQGIDRHQHQVVDRAPSRLKLEQQRIGLQARAFAGRAGRIGAVLRQQHPDVHLVGLALQPVEKPPYAIPDAGPGFLPVLPLGLALEHPVAVFRAQLPPRCVEWNAALFRVFREIVLALLETRRLPGADRAVAQRLRFVRHDQTEVDADHAPEAAAGVAGAERRIEGKQARHRLAVLDVAVGAMQSGGKTPDFTRRCRILTHYVDIHLALADAKSGFQGLADPGFPGRSHAQTVLHDFEHRP